jgi:hypothetical protein
MLEKRDLNQTQIGPSNYIVTIGGEDVKEDQYKG